MMKMKIVYKNGSMEDLGSITLFLSSLPHVTHEKTECNMQIKKKGAMVLLRSVIFAEWCGVYRNATFSM